MVANTAGITNSISPSTVGRILTEANIKPHRSKYWEFPNIEDQAAFSEKAAEICEVYHNSVKELKNRTHTISVDEKTGMQALSRINPETLLMAQSNRNMVWNINEKNSKTWKF